jgi:hypothetical protein
MGRYAVGSTVEEYLSATSPTYRTQKTTVKRSVSKVAKHVMFIQRAGKPQYLGGAMLAVPDVVPLYAGGAIGHVMGSKTPISVLTHGTKAKILRRMGLRTVGAYVGGTTAVVALNVAGVALVGYAGYRAIRKKRKA